MTEEKKKGIYIPYSYFLTSGLICITAFVSLSIGVRWETTWFYHMLFAGALGGLSIFGIVLGVPVLNVLKRNSITPEMVELARIKANQNSATSPVSTNQQLMAHGDYEDDPVDRQQFKIQTVRKDR